MKAMKKLIAMASVAVLTLAGCKQEQFDDRRTPDNYYASMERFGSDTKTALGESRSVVWSSEDRIAIFEGSSEGQAYQVLDSYIGKSSGEFSQVEGLTTNGDDAVNGTIAVYPFNENLSVTATENNYEITGVIFPSEQRHIAGSFSDEAFPMAALAAEGSKNLSFKNIGGILKLSLTGSYSVSQITLTGNSGELLSGSAIVTLGSDGIPSVAMSDDASTSMSLICDPAVQLDPETATDFYISIPPTDFEAGFKVTILDGEGKEHGLATHKTNPAERSSILALPESTPESLDGIELTADTFCSVDFIEGWTETRFGGDGTIVFIKEDDMGRMTHSLMLLPNDETVLMPVYIRFDEKEVPSYMSFMNTEIYINGYTDSTVDFTLAVEDAVWSVKDVPCSELVPYSLQTRAWADNNGIRNACAIGNCIVGAVDIGLGVLLIGGAVVVEGGSVGLATPAAVPTIAAGLVQIGAGCKSLYDGFSTIFGPADQKRDPYIANMIIDSSLEGLAQFLEHIEVKENPIIQNFPKEITEEAKRSGKIGLASFIAGMSIAAIDAKWGKTYTGPATLAEVHQEVQVVTGRADNVTEHSAELYGYVSPVATAPFGEKIVTEIYIVLWKAEDESHRKNHSIFNSDGGTVSFTFTGLVPDTEYCYQTIFEDCYNKKYRFGEVNTFKTKEESTLREQLIKLYYDTNGDNWVNNGNWCSDEPIEEWYGVYRIYEDYYHINLNFNNLVGDAVLNNPKIKCIEVVFNQLTSLDVSGCTALTELNCNTNQLTSLDVSGCTALERVEYSENPLESINLSGCRTLSKFTIRECVSSLNLSGCTALTDLDCSYNQLTSLDVSGCTALTYLNCSDNQLTSLDISSCTALDCLLCRANQLTSLDVSGCTALTYLHCGSNQLTSLDVSGCTALTDLSCGYNQLTALDVSGYTALTELYCNTNQMTALDVSGCTALTYLHCVGNQLTSLDVSGCTALTELDCDDHQLTSLDVSGCTALTNLYCGYNQLTSLDISSCTALDYLLCYNNQLTSLNLSGCTALTYLDCNNNQLTSLNLSGCTSLTYLDCSINQLTSLDVSGCTALTDLRCGANQLTSVDVSGLTALTDLRCGGNQLTSLDVSGCTALTKLNCDYSQLTSLDASGCTALTELYCDYSQLTSLDVSGCTSLTYLSCRYSQLTSLDASGCTELDIFVSHIPECVSSLNLSGCTALDRLYWSNNQLTALDVTGCTALTKLYCDYNQLTSLDVSGCTALTYLNCRGNQLTSLDVSGCTALLDLDCRNNLFFQEIPPEFYSIFVQFDRRYTNYWHEWHYDKDGHKVGCDWHYTDNKIGFWVPGEPEIWHSNRH